MNAKPSVASDLSPDGALGQAGLDRRQSAALRRLGESAWRRTRRQGGFAGLALAVLAGLAACGQKGPLTLPSPPTAAKPGPAAPVASAPPARP